MSDNPILKADEPTFLEYERLMTEWKEHGGPKPALKWAMGLGAFITFEGAPNTLTYDQLHDSLEGIWRALEED